MAFLGSLGIDVKLLASQLVNFGILLWLLTLLLYKPVIKRIEESEAEVEKARIQNEKNARDQQALEEQRTKELADAQQRAREIITEAETIAKKMEDRTRAETEAEKKAVISQIKERLSELEHGTRS